MDVTTGNESVLAGVPRQRSADDEAAYRAALSELAAVASSHVSRRDEVRAEVEVERVVYDAKQERTQSTWRRAGVVALVVAIAACVTTIIMTMPKKPHAQSGQDTVPAASVATARALGASAHTRLTDQSVAVTSVTCLSAYATDAAASPLLLPPASRESVLRDSYIAACLGP